MDIPRHQPPVTGEAASVADAAAPQEDHSARRVHLAAEPYNYYYTRGTLNSSR